VIEVRRAASRLTTTTPGITTRHGLSSGAHYDPDNLSFGGLVAHDLHVVAPGAGFDTHPHRGLEIVSWVLSGTLHHEDAHHRTTVRHGTVQHASTGSGIEHAERNGGDDELRFVQMWLLGELGTPAYRVAGPTVELPDARFRAIAAPVHLAAAPFVHVFVADGTATVAGTQLNAGDEVRITDEPVSIEGTAELLVWEIGRGKSVDGAALRP